MFKKLISLTLVLSLVLCICAVSPVYAEKITRPDSADFLEQLGIMEHIEGVTYSANVTREDFAYYTAQISKLPLDGNDQTRKFIDVPTECYAFKSINTLAVAGIISQNDEGTFRPEEYITYGEAYTMLLNLLGYKEMANATGAWPMGYLQIAKQLGLNIGDCYDKVNLAGACKLIFEALQAPIYKISEINQYGNKYEANDEETLLWLNYGIKFGEGKVSSVYGATLSTLDVSRRKKVTISGEKFTVDENIDESKFFATYVKYFYYDNDENNNICFMIRKKGAEDKIVDINDFDCYKNGKLYFYENENTKNSKREDVSQNAIIVYNGMPINTDVDKTLNSLNKGSITYKDANGDKEYDTIVIYDYKNFVVQSVDSANKRVYDKLTKTEITFSDCDYYKILVGEKSISVDDLVVNVVLSVAMSQDKKIVTAIANSMNIEGEVESIGDDYVYINGTSQNIEKTYIDEFKNKVTVGGTYTFHFDSFNNIAYISKIGKSKMVFGYLIKAITQGNSIEEKLSIKTLTAESKIEYLSFAKKVKIDGVEYKNTEDMLACFCDNSGNVIAQPFEYTLNSEGKITDVDTLTQNPKEDENYSIRKAFDFETTGASWIQDGRYMMDALFSANTIGFMVSDDLDADDKYFSAGTWVQAVGTSAEANGKYEPYYRSKNSAYVDVLVKIKSGLKYKDERNVVMVTSTGSGLDSDGDTVTVISGIDSTGANISVKAESDKCNDIYNKGDLVSVAYFENGETAAVTKVYDAQKGGEPKGFAYDDGDYLLLVQGEQLHCYRAVTQISFGYAKRTFDEGVASWSRKFGGKETERAKVPTKIAVYDKELDIVYTGGIGDINGYDDFGDKCSKIFYHTYVGVPRGMFVYK